jgi:cellulose synthase/poly-beta-1,6-N-acetylglucosamine synthase-like glycosyltransferase
MNNTNHNLSISVIIPVYNQQESFLKHCIESILSQDYQNFELIISDNYSNNTSVVDCSYSKYPQEKPIDGPDEKESDIVALDDQLPIATINKLSNSIDSNKELKNRLGFIFVFLRFQI